MSRSSAAACLVVSCCAIGCGGGNPNAPDASAPGAIVGTGASAQKTIGAAGGTITLAGATLVIPPRALAADVAITITSTRELPPLGYDNRSPLYRFEPHGLKLAQPATVTLAFAGDGADIHLFWSSASGPELEDLGGTISGSQVTASVTHFSDGVGTHGCRGPSDFTAGETPCLRADGRYLCVDLNSSAHDCGSCGQACPDGSDCKAGKCEKCAVGTTFCGGLYGACANLTDSYWNCGACGHSCLGGNCIEGICCSGIRPYFDVCNGKCADLLHSVDDCGKCGNKCPADCVDGQCQPCPKGTTYCRYAGVLGALGLGYCRDLLTDSTACGSCNNVCPIDPKTQLIISCINGACEGVDAGSPPDAGCPMGQAQCNNGCTDTKKDPANCGMCGIACPDGPCVNGACTMQCQNGLSYCANEMPQCVALTTVFDCGACGVKCGGKVPACCQKACHDVATDDHVCGACNGPDCTATGSVCCPIVGNNAPGCVKQKNLQWGLQVSNYNCGVCGTTCNQAQGGTAICCSKKDGTAACTDYTTDDMNCGGCSNGTGAHFCVNGQHCMQGSCR